MDNRVALFFDRSVNFDYYNSNRGVVKWYHIGLQNR